jgi:DNA-binding response OmpR family regulator
MQATLAAKGYSVSVVSSLAELIEVLAERNPAVAVLDVLDPVLPDVEALRTLPGVLGALALVLVARRNLKKHHTRLFQFQQKEGTFVSRSTEMLSDAVARGVEELERLRGVVRVGNTTVDPNELVLHALGDEFYLQPAVCSVLVYLMRRYPHPVPEQELRTNVVAFAADTVTDSVYTRIRRCRIALKNAAADIQIVTLAAGYRIEMRAERERDRQTERERERTRLIRNCYFENGPGDPLVRLSPVPAPAMSLAPSFP